MAMEWLLMTKATMDSHQRDLVLNTNITRCKNEAWAIEAIKEVEVYCTATIKEVKTCWAIHACALEKSHKESMLEVECEVIAEEGCLGKIPQGKHARGGV